MWALGDLVMIDLLTGVASSSWDHQHIVGHHGHTNVFGVDPVSAIADVAPSCACSLCTTLQRFQDLPSSKQGQYLALCACAWSLGRTCHVNVDVCIDHYRRVSRQQSWRWRYTLQHVYLWPLYAFGFFKFRVEDFSESA